MGLDLIEPVRVVVVDDHPVVREGVIAVLGADDDVEVVGEAESGEDALPEVDRLRPDVVVLDVRLPGMTGIETGKALLARHPQLKILLLTSFPNEGVLRAAMTMGAHGILVKESNAAVMRQAVHAVAGGGRFVDPAVEAKVRALSVNGRRAKGPHGLTLMEMRVLELLPKGLTNKEIGGLLGVSVATVKTHMTHAMRKLQVRSRAEATAVAMREGLG